MSLGSVSKVSTNCGQMTNIWENMPVPNMEWIDTLNMYF